MGNIQTKWSRLYEFVIDGAKIQVEASAEITSTNSAEIQGRQSREPCRATCAVCLELFRPPIKYLRCGHSFCYRCLIGIQRATPRGQRETIRCPICRQTTDLPQGRVRRLFTNVTLENVLAEIFRLDNSAEAGDRMTNASMETQASRGNDPVERPSTFHRTGHFPSSVTDFPDNTLADVTDGIFDGSERSMSVAQTRVVPPENIASGDSFTARVEEAAYSVSVDGEVEEGEYSVSVDDEEEERLYDPSDDEQSDRE